MTPISIDAVLLNLYTSIRNLFRQLSEFPPYLCTRKQKSIHNQIQNDNEQDSIYHRYKLGIRQDYGGTLCGQRMERGGYGQELRAQQHIICLAQSRLVSIDLSFTLRNYAFR